MFFGNILVKSKSLSKAWRAAYSQNNEISEVSLVEICRDIDMSNDDIYRKRLSLRTSATLIGGAARIYKQKIDELLQDVQSLDSELVTRRRRKLEVKEIFTDSSETQPVSTPEKTKRTAKFSSDVNSSISSEKAKKSKVSTPKNDHFFSFFSDVSAITTTEKKKTDSSDGSIILGSLNKKDNGRSSKKKSTTPRAKYKSTQTNTDVHLDTSKDEIDKSLPFGYLMVYNNYDSRIPSSIILTSVKPID